MDGNEFFSKYGPWALVTGASSGIGLAIATRLAERGLMALPNFPESPHIAENRSGRLSRGTPLPDLLEHQHQHHQQGAARRRHAVGDSTAVWPGAGLAASASVQMSRPADLAGGDRGALAPRRHRGGVADQGRGGRRLRIASARSSTGSSPTPRPKVSFRSALPHSTACARPGPIRRGLRDMTVPPTSTSPSTSTRARTSPSSSTSCSPWSTTRRRRRSWRQRCSSLMACRHRQGPRHRRSMPSPGPRLRRSTPAPRRH